PAFAKFTIPIPFRAFLTRHSYLYYFANTYVYQRLARDKMRDLLRQDLLRAGECGPYQVLRALVAKMREVTARQGASLALALIPAREEVERGATAVQGPILDFCRQDDLRCVSLLEDLTAARRSGARVYFERDIHWTRTGHRVAAGALKPFLEGML